MIQYYSHWKFKLPNNNNNPLHSITLGTPCHIWAFGFFLSSVDKFSFSRPPAWILWYLHRNHLTTRICYWLIFIAENNRAERHSVSFPGLLVCCLLGQNIRPLNIYIFNTQLFVFILSNPRLPYPEIWPIRKQIFSSQEIRYLNTFSNTYT